MGSYALDKIMPQNTRRILQYTHKHAYFRALVLYSRTGIPILYAEQLAQLAEARKTPVAFLRNEAMMCVCSYSIHARLEYKNEAYG